MEPQGNLFSGEEEMDFIASSAADGKTSSRNLPLAARMRPRKLSDVVGQDHILSEGKLLPRLVKTNSFGSLLFYGPPGSGKTSIAEAIAGETQNRFVRINAVMSNVAELRQILALARRIETKDTILFIDEIHRFNKAQQDLLLPDVEAGHIRLIGATTHNPGFYVNAPLVSRSHLFRLEAHSTEIIVSVMRRSLEDGERGLGEREHTVDDKTLKDLAKLCDGDLRRALNALEVIALGLEPQEEITSEEIAVFAAERQIRYDADEDEHYNTISAFIKSMRGGDPDAALYWLAKMLAGGEDPRFIARRLIILASEDVGLADCHALPLAVATQQACEFVGLPECELNLAHCVVYMAMAPKSNSSYKALQEAKRAIAEEPVQEVPVWLKDSGGQVSKALGHSKDYAYSHSFPENVSGQEYLLEPKSFYEPKRVGDEVAIEDRLNRWKELKRKAQQQD